MGNHVSHEVSAGSSENVLSHTIPAVAMQIEEIQERESVKTALAAVLASTNVKVELPKALSGKGNIPAIHGVKIRAKDYCPHRGCLLSHLLNATTTSHHP